MKNLLRTISIFLIAAAILFVLRTFKPGHINIPREEIWPVMGTVASLRTPPAARSAFPEMLAIAQTGFAEVNDRLSVYNPESELSHLNATGILESPSPLMQEFLDTTVDMVQRTGGRFDPTLLPVIRLWGFSGGQAPDPLPTPQAIAEALERPALGQLQRDAHTVSFQGARPTIDSGGIAKGFAIDRAFNLIREAHPDSDFLLNLGGEMRVHGQAEPQRAWRIGIQHPFEKGSNIGALRLASGKAVATSGHYERYFEHDGTRYAHIINPLTGWPVTGMAAVTVLCPDATQADVLSTALFVAGIEEAMQVLAAFPGSEALLIPDTQPMQIYLSPGMAAAFEPAPAYRHAVHPLPQ